MDVREAYQDTLAYVSGLSRFGMRLGLQRMHALTERLGHPERALRVIHIGGTNGKGSTAAMITAILRQAGYRVGLFISPHLHDVRERISVNGQMISEEHFASLAQILRVHIAEMVAAGLEHPTEFEFYTALALEYFREQQTDFTVLEVGLGGALDSTNVVQPLVSVITNVARDHVEQLGQRIAEIAGVKAGIIKSGAPAVTAAQDPQALRVLEKQAGCAGVRLWRVGEDVRWQVREQTEEGQSFDLYGIQEVFPALKMRLVGAHQFRNAAVAVTIGELLRMEYGVRIPTAAVYEALRDVQWPGRLELISLRPKILLDGAHNPDGAQALAEALRLYKRRRLRMCLGILADKEREKVLDILVPLADELIITRPNSERAGDWETVATYAGKFGKPVRAVADPQDAAQAGIAGLSPDDMLCVSGSLYMLADLRKALLHLTRQE